LPENHPGSIKHFGQQEKFFIRFDRNTGLPQISFDLQNWQAYTSGTPVNISREEQATVIDISNNLQTINTLQEQQQTLATTLAEQQGELEQVQEQLDTLQLHLLTSSDDLAITESDLSNQESTRNVLENTMKPEAKLRTDTHPIAENTALDDTTKTTLTQTALNTYDAYEGTPEAP
jgi:predicted RNase H-like nuclease (RuvC/YqgF family)